ncbi:phage/plasmid primase, P4 family [Lysinibacillus sphaericus]|uniref:phage/plasmid primase, P4 family n=1 Tax=Lysinibacillus sphaericus TaxID=1421 RepID=UPI001A9FDC83|nr:phage/plasmid primase, P4 family [Lysinibacillus sphaericus]QTB29065.1 DNA primase [Lysinibacillus sphaericus]
MAITNRDEILLVVSENIPDELKQYKNWILWRAIWNEQRKQYEKVPYQVNGKDKASVSEESTWSTFDVVIDAYEHGIGDGVGYVLTDKDPYSCIDGDDIQDVDDLPELAQEIVKLSYAEVSPSREGIHVWIKGFSHNSDKFKNKNIELGFELYDKKRFITFTGESLNTLPINSGPEIESFINKIFKREEPKQQLQPPQNKEGRGKAALPEADIIRIARKSKKGEVISACMDGGWEHYYRDQNGRPDQSSAVMGFCNELAFFTNCDYWMMDNIFRKSALMYDKWNRPQNSTTWGDEQLQKAIRECVDTFKPSVNDKDNISWWRSNGNGTISFIHHVLAKEVLKKYSIVRYPNPHSDLYYFNSKKGIYEQDKSGRQINGIIRSFDDDLKNSQIREVYHYIQDMSPVINRVNENYIALENGLLNLKSFQLEAFNSKVFVLQKVGVRYDPNAYDQFVESTLHKVTKGHEPSIKNIKEMFGCVLYPGLLVPKMFYLYGRSAHNGKSSILNMIHYTFNRDGGNISAVPPQKLASNTFAGASLYGKLANVVDDQPDQVIEDSGTLKTVITGGYIEIEKKGKDSETVKMSTVMITASNFFPNFRESGAQINRRLHIIPFEHNFSLDKECLPDGESLERISSDSAREYVLKLAVDALKEMLSHSKSEKLTENDKSLETAKAFAEHNDPMADYFFEHDEEYFNEMPGARVLAEYEEWCRDNRVQAIDTQRFKEIICGQFNMEWKTKKIKYNGIWKSFKGFKSKNN